MKFKTPITYWGGKQTLAPTICNLIPDHKTYCEPFFGGGAVFFAKPKSKVEIINDLNREVINFYRQVVCNFEALQERIKSTPHSRGLYKDAIVIYNNPHLFNELDRAWAFFVATNQGYCGQVGSWGFGTSTNSIEKKLNNQRINFTTELKERLDMTQIECKDAIELIKLRDTESTFFYIDPPYFNSDMAHYKGYSIHDFTHLLEVLSSIKGKFLLSSYPSEVLEAFKIKNNWSQMLIKKPTNASKTRKEKTEVLTSNYPLD
jgi:DNA adenine methylase